MRTGLLALAVLAAPAAAPAADPPVVFQTQPIGRLVDDARATVKLLAGDREAKDFDKALTQGLGEKGFDGLDLSRPVVGYVVVPADPKQTVAVLALPVTTEEAFAAFCERWNKSKPKPLGGGAYEVPALDPALTALAKVADGYAYIATGAKGVDLAKAVGPDRPAFEKLYDPTETAQAAARVYFDRFPKELRDKALAGLDEAKRALAVAKLPPEVGDAAKEAFDQFVKLSTRYIDLSKGAKEAGLRLTLDPASGGLRADLSLVAVEGSPLAKEIAARKPTTNAFAGLLTPDVVTGFRTRLPLFNQEIRDSAVIGLEAIRKQAVNNIPVGQPLVKEFFDGAVRTAKGGDVDVVGVMRGPDANGAYTAVGAAVFDDPSGVEKELKKLLAGTAPPEFNDLIRWDAEKAGDQSIHVLDLGKSNEDFAREAKKLFGPDVVVAAAFTPKAVVAAIGPDAVAAVKAALELKPAPAPVLEVVLNPAKVARMFGAVDERGAGEIVRTWGKGEKPLSIASVSVSGGAELKVSVGLNLRLAGGVFLGRAWAGGGATFEPVEPPLIKE